jgi:hypothetical protein
LIHTAGFAVHAAKRPPRSTLADIDPAPMK